MLFVSNDICNILSSFSCVVFMMYFLLYDSLVYVISVQFCYIFLQKITHVYNVI